MCPWSLHERLDERDIAELITAYRNGATAASLATTHSVASAASNASYAPPVSAAPSIRGSEKATPTTPNP